MNDGHLYSLFRYSFRCEAPRALVALLAGLGLWLSLPGRSHAAAAVVTVAKDLTAASIWRQEQPYWKSLVTEIKRQVKLTEDLAKWTGNPKSSASSIVGGVASVLDPTQCILGLADRKKALSEGRSAHSLEKTGRTALQPELRIESSVQLLGKTQKRDEKRYTAFAEQAALLARHDEAIRLLRELEQKELKIQRGLLERLKSAQTHAEMAAIQAALTASHQRCSLAANKAEQARDEAARHEAQFELERQRKREADREWTEMLVDRLRQRALTSLHAQRGQNS